MKTMNRPSASVISLSTALSRSSNSPRNFAPAMSAPMSSETSCLFLRLSGTSPFDDPLRQALDDRGLADAGLADEHRVVLRAARQHLNDAADLFVAADDGIELALASRLGQVARIALKRLVLIFGILIGDAMRAAHLPGALRAAHRASRRRWSAGSSTRCP